MNAPAIATTAAPINYRPVQNFEVTARQTAQRLNNAVNVFPVQLKAPAYAQDFPSWKDSIPVNNVHVPGHWLWRKATGYGVAPVHPLFAILDCDDPAFIEKVFEAIPRLKDTYTVGRGDHRHFYVYLAHSLKQAYLTLGEKPHEIASLRGTGAYVVGAGSKHPEGDTYSLLVNAEPICLSVNETQLLVGLFEPKVKPTPERKATTRPPVDKGEEDIVALVELAINTLNPDMPYGNISSGGWIQIIWLCSALGADGLRIADDWSSRGQDYKPGEVEKKFNSFHKPCSKPNKLFALADKADPTWRKTPEYRKAAGLPEIPTRVEYPLPTGSVSPNGTPANVDPATGEIVDAGRWAMNGQLTEGGRKLIFAFVQGKTPRSVLMALAALDKPFTRKQIEELGLSKRQVDQCFESIEFKAFVRVLPSYMLTMIEEPETRTKPSLGRKPDFYEIIPIRDAIEVYVQGKAAPRIKKQLTPDGKTKTLPAALVTAGASEREALILAGQVNENLPDDPTEQEYLDRLQAEREAFNDLTPIAPIAPEHKADPVVGMIAAAYQQNGEHRVNLKALAAEFKTSEDTIRAGIDRAGLYLGDTTHERQLKDPDNIPTKFVKGEGHVKEYYDYDTDRYISAKSPDKAKTAIESGHYVAAVYRHSGILRQPNEKDREEMAERARRRELRKTHPAPVKASTSAPAYNGLWFSADDAWLRKHFDYIRQYPAAFNLIAHLAPPSEVKSVYTPQEDLQAIFTLVREDIAQAADDTVAKHVHLSLLDTWLSLDGDAADDFVLSLDLAQRWELIEQKASVAA